MRVPVLALLSLQTSFLLPPFGYAVMMARTIAPVRVALRPLSNQDIDNVLENLPEVPDR